MSDPLPPAPMSRIGIGSGLPAPSVRREACLNGGDLLAEEAAEFAAGGEEFSVEFELRRERVGLVRAAEFFEERGVGLERVRVFVFAMVETGRGVAEV
jgi:hypothetical protein